MRGYTRDGHHAAMIGLLAQIEHNCEELEVANDICTKLHFDSLRCHLPLGKSHHTGIQDKHVHWLVGKARESIIPGAKGFNVVEIREIELCKMDFFLVRTASLEGVFARLKCFGGVPAAHHHSTSTLGQLHSRFKPNP